MYIRSLTLKNFRNYRNIKIDFSNGINFFTGKNAQGKSSLLEAIYFLATARSYRTNRIRELIRFDAEGFFLKGDIEKESGYTKVQIYYGTNKKKLLINNNPVDKFIKLLGHSNVVAFVLEDIDLIAGEAKQRRKFLDIHLSLLDVDYLTKLREYRRILKSRNNTLKEKALNSNNLNYFSDRLIEIGSEIVYKRYKAVKALNHLAKIAYKKISLDQEIIEIKYKSALSQKELKEIKIEYQEKVERNLTQDIKYQTTTIGPHRDDIDFSINAKKAKEYASTGQQRSIVLALKLAKVDIIRNIIKTSPIILIDDVLNELDEDRLNAFYPLLCGDKQVLMTCTKNSKIYTYLKEATKYEVTNGEIKTVNLV